MDWLIDPFELAFQQKALIGGSLAAVSLALVGTWVVIRGMTFLGDALVHGVIPGIALAILFDFNVLLGAGLAAGLMILGINLVHRQTAFSEDTGIGLLFVGMLALGVIIISTTASYQGSLTGILFGDALGITTGDIVALLVVLGLTLVVTLVFYRSFLVLSFNELKAQLLGFRPRAAHITMLAMITLAIVSSFQTVGTLLVFGLLVGPPATAVLLARRLPVIMITAGMIGVFSVAVGLVVSYHADTSGSATMALVPIVMFFVVLTVKNLWPGRAATHTPDSLS
ncbi:MAG TPA: zinc ABC transporter permease AztB [Acidimicrobiia bacterium]